MVLVLLPEEEEVLALGAVFFWSLFFDCWLLLLLLLLLREPLAFLIAGAVIVSVVGRTRFVLGSGGIQGGSRSFVPTDLGLPFPVALVERSDELLKRL